MPSLIDIAPPESVKQTASTTRGEIDVQAVPAEVWAALYSRHPQLMRVVQGGNAIQSLDAGDIEGMTGIYEAMAALVGASAALADNVDWGSEKHFEVALTLSVEDLFAALQKVINISYPAEYMRPLRDALRRNGHAGEQDGRVSATK